MTGKAKRTLLYGGYGAHMDKLHWIEQCRPTHVSIGLNSPVAANRHHRFELMESVRQDGKAFAEAIQARGAQVVLHVWLAANEDFIREAARKAARLAWLWGAVAVVPNPELAFKGDADPDPNKHLLEQARLKEAAEADHSALCRLFLEEARAVWAEALYTCAIWPAVFYWVPHWCQELVRGADGLIAQMQSFRNPNKPGSMVDDMNPGPRQEQAWRSLERWRKPDDPTWMVWGQQAIYHQNFGVPPEESVRLACDTYLEGARGPGEDGLAFWELWWLDHEPWAAPVIASYRLPEVGGEQAAAAAADEGDGEGRYRVMLAQVILWGLGYYHGLRDGDYGLDTTSAVMAFQRDVRHLNATGLLDPDTWGALCAAGEVAVELRGYGEPPDGVWPRLPGELLETFDELAQACVAHGVGYGPGRGWYDDTSGAFVVTQGPFGLASARYRTRDKEHTPAFVCSTFTYFVACYLLRQQDLYNEALGGGQPPIWDVLLAEHKVHTRKGYGPFLGLGPFFKPVYSDGSSAVRWKKARPGGYVMDLLEAWERMDELPELMLGGWASAARGFIHHCAALRVDRDRRELRFVDAGGSKSGGTFSGTDMDITVIASREEARAAAKKGWGRWFGFWPGEELVLALSAPKPRLGFEHEPGEVTLLGALVEA